MWEGGGGELFYRYPSKGRTKCYYISEIKVAFSVADPGCLSRILIFTHPGSRIPDPGSRIPDPKTAAKERGEKKLIVITFYVATNFTKLQIILVVKC